MGNPSVKFGHYIPRTRENTLFSGVSVTDNKAIVLFNTDPKKYKGKFGFDWCEWNLDNGTIQKFQGTEASDIEYTFNDTEKQYKPATSINAQKILKSLYPVENIGFGKKYYTAWMNLPTGVEANLKLTTICLESWKKPTEGEKEYITFNPNPDYDVTYNEQLNADIRIPLKKKGTYDIGITAKNETKQASYIEAVDEKNNIVGVMEMHPNKKIDLDIKIIPIVFKSTEEKEKSEAIALYSKTIKAKTTDLGNNLNETLNKHSLNQAGISCKIEAIKETSNKSDGTIEKGPERIVIDLTTKNWGKFYDETLTGFKNWKYGKDETDPKKRPEPIINADGHKLYEIGSEYDEAYYLEKFIETYYEKYDKSRLFKGALIFITDTFYLEYDEKKNKHIKKEDNYGVSKSYPKKNNGIILFKNGIDKSYTYSHEIGHMLGLPHYFIDEKTNENIKKNNETVQKNKPLIEDAERVIKKNMEVINENITLIEEEVKRATFFEGKEKEFLEYYDEDGDEDTKQNANNYKKKAELARNSEEELKKEKESAEKENKIARDKINEGKEVEDRLISHNKIITEIKYRIKQSKSTNFMDYYVDFKKFNKQQCTIIQNEVNVYYK